MKWLDIINIRKKQRPDLRQKFRQAVDTFSDFYGVADDTVVSQVYHNSDMCLEDNQSITVENDDNFVQRRIVEEILDKEETLKMLKRLNPHGKEVSESKKIEYSKKKNPDDILKIEI